MSEKIIWNIKTVYSYAINVTCSNLMFLKNMSCHCENIQLKYSPTPYIKGAVITIEYKIIENFDV